MPTKRKPIPLKPCPFCGGPANVAELKGRLFAEGVDHFYVICTKCGTQSRIMRRRQDAVIRWNRRKT